MKIKHFKEKIVGSTGSISGAASILGSWQICHNVCLGLITILGLIGITLNGMPTDNNKDFCSSKCSKIYEAIHKK